MELGDRSICLMVMTATSNRCWLKCSNVVSWQVDFTPLPPQLGWLILNHCQTHWFILIWYKSQFPLLQFTLRIWYVIKAHWRVAKKKSFQGMQKILQCTSTVFFIFQNVNFQRSMNVIKLKIIFKVLYQTQSIARYSCRSEIMSQMFRRRLQKCVDYWRTVKVIGWGEWDEESVERESETIPSSLDGG